MKKINLRMVALLSFSFVVLIACVLSWTSPVANALRSGSRINGLMIGSDWVDYSQHSDTIIFMSYAPRTQFLDIMSVPRDTHVSLPDVKVNRINEAYAYYYKKNKDHGVAATALTKIVTDIFANSRLEVKYYFQVDYDTFRKFIDLIGPIQLEVEENMKYDDTSGKLHINFTSGTYRLNGQKALEYVRYRSKSAGDIGRIYRQQRFIKAMLRRIASPVFVAKLPQITGLVMNNLHTNLSVWDMLNILLEVRHIRTHNVRMAQVPGKPMGYMWAINAEELGKALENITGPEMLAVKEKDKVPTVEVFNASSHSGAAIEVTRKLRDIGFDVVDFKNYPTRQKKTIVIDRVGDIRAAQRITSVLNTDEIFTRYDSNRMIDLSVIIGEDYRTK